MNISDITEVIKDSLIEYFDDIYFEQLEIDNNLILVRASDNDGNTNSFVITVEEK